MSSLIVKIIKIGRIEKHTNADRLQIAYAEGMDWPVVVGLNQFSIGDKAIYVPVDAILDEKLESYLFPPDSKIVLHNHRVKAIKIRSFISTGMFVELSENLISLYPKLKNKKADEDVADILNITKFEPPLRSLPKNMRGKIVKKNHPDFKKYLDIESYKFYTGIFEPDEIVSATEKYHGCVQYNTLIKTISNENKRINQLKEGDSIVGIDKDGNVAESKIIKVHIGNKSENWLNIKTTREKIGRGNSFGSITCTPEHMFFNPLSKKYVNAENLTVGDTVTVMRSEYDLTPIQIQILIGKLLGDASICINEDSAAIYGSQAAKYKEYITFFCDALGDIYKNIKENYYISGYGTDMIRWSTFFNGILKEKFSSFIENNRKTIPEWVIKEIGPIALAIWYMDDGSLGHGEDNSEDKANFATCSFDENECEILVKCFEKFGIKATKYIQIKKENNKRFWKIRLNSDEAEKLFLLITPYIPSIMQYKLPKRYRGYNAWLPKQNNQYKPILSNQKIISINPIKPHSKTKYDLTTTTNNYFANNILVHNSNWRGAVLVTRPVSLINKLLKLFHLLPKYSFVLGSHNIQLDVNKTLYYDRNIYAFVEKKYSLKEKLLPGEELFGEVYGMEVQKGFSYGMEQGDLGFVAFDIMKDGKYLDYPDFVKICNERNIPRVNELFIGKFSDLDINKLSTGSSSVMKNNKSTQPVREGIVVKSYIDSFHPRLGRKVVKIINPDYLMLKDIEDWH